MKPLSPVDAVVPAFSRIPTVLTPPAQPGTFRFGFFLKMAAVGAFTNPGFYGTTLACAGLGLSFTMLALTGRIWHSEWMAAPAAGALLLTASVMAAVAALALSLLLAWLWCRLRFTLFDLVVGRRGQVAAAWSAYGAQSWRYLGLMVLVTLALLLLAASTAGPLFLRFIAAIRGMTLQQINASPAVVFAHILPVYGILFVLEVTATFADAIAQDFLLPPMALEDAPLQSAFGHLFRLLRDRFWSVVGYLLLRFALEIGLTCAGMLAVLLLLGAAAAAAAGLGFILYGALWHLGGAAALAFILYCAAAATLLLGLWLLAMIAAYGVLAIFRQCYAIYFYGSYYQELGNRLEPPEQTAAAPLAPVVPPLLPQPPPVW